MISGAVVAAVFVAFPAASAGPEAAPHSLEAAEPKVVAAPRANTGVPAAVRPGRAVLRARGKRLGQRTRVRTRTSRRRRVAAWSAECVKRLVRYLERRKWPHVKAHYDWAIGVYEGASPLGLSAPDDLTNPVLTAADVKDVTADFVADPFVVHEDGRWHMFVEVMNRASGRGEIGWATSPDFRSWSYQGIVLREPFHLSYPSVFRWEDEWLMIPESTEANGLRLYRAERFPERWTLASTILEGQFKDHALVRHDELWWLFVGKSEGPYPDDGNALELYFAETLDGPWQAHPLSPIITSDPRFTRPAGKIIPTDTGLLRLAQDCSSHYGKEVNAARIEALTTTDYREEILGGRVLAPGAEPWNRRGMHHVDAHEVAPGRWLAAVDGYRRWFSLHWR